MILRLSQKLNTKIKAGTLKAKPLDANPYADWSAHLFTADRTQYILVSNTPSLYSVVLYGKGITNDSVFIERALSSLREFMEDDGQTFVYQKFIAPASGTVSFAKALDRSVTGSMNELIKFAKLWLTPGDISPFDVGFRLNDVLMSAIAPSKKKGHGKPNEAFRALADSPETRVGGEHQNKDREMDDHKRATPNHPIHDLIARRWSPYAFSERPVPDDDLLSLLEAARWAASSYNEQPWSYIVATKANPEEFERLLSCLVEVNQVWAKTAPVLALGCINLCFSHNNKPNAAAVHDLGLASAGLTLEATARGLFVHQMIGILPDKARDIHDIPEGVQPLTGLAIGYVADPSILPDGYRERDLASRQRRDLSEFVFGGKWGTTSKLVK